MDSFLQSLVDALQQTQSHLVLTLGFIGILYAIQILNVLVGYRLNVLGIWPRHFFGLIGIPFSPLLHGNFQHLILNTLPLFVFSNFILLQGQMILIHVTVIIVVLSGALIWLFGRSAIHIGASALIMGYLGFISIGVYHQPTALSIIVALVCVFYFGSLFINLLPSHDKYVSWEGHVFGFISGIAAAWLI